MVWCTFERGYTWNGNITFTCQSQDYKWPTVVRFFVKENKSMNPTDLLTAFKVSLLHIFGDGGALKSSMVVVGGSGGEGEDLGAY